MVVAASRNHLYRRRLQVVIDAGPRNQHNGKIIPSSKSLVGSLPSHIPIQKSCQNYSSANLGVESRSWIKAFPLQFGSISHFLCDAAAKFEVKALVPWPCPVKWCNSVTVGA